MNLSKRVLDSSFSATVGIADKAQIIREQGRAVYDFSAGRAFEPTPAYITRGTIAAINAGDTHQTMARGKTIYRNAIAEKLKRDNKIDADPEKEVIATMGCKQGLTIGLLACINPGDEVIVEDPCFVSYTQTVHYLGGKAVKVPLKAENGFRWTKDDLEKAVTKRTKVIILCSPHNPTGVVHSKKDLQIIADVAIKNNLIVITDEVYERVVWNGHKHTNLATLPGMKDRTITLMSFTKSFSMGGWRVGFIYSSENIIKELEKLQQHLITSVNSFVQIGAAIACGKPQDEVLDYWLEWEKKVFYCTDYIDGIKGLKCHRPEGGFYAWVDISQLGTSSYDFTEQLLEKESVAIVHGSSFGEFGENYVRFTCVKSWDELEEGLKRLKRFAQSH